MERAIPGDTPWCGWSRALNHGTTQVAAACVFDHQAGRNTVGALVQANYGFRETLAIAGVPVGREITDDMHDLPDGSDLVPEE